MQDFIESLNKLLLPIIRFFGNDALGFEELKLLKEVSEENPSYRLLFLDEFEKKLYGCSFSNDERSYIQRYPNRDSTARAIATMNGPLLEALIDDSYEGRIEILTKEDKNYRGLYYEGIFAMFLSLCAVIFVFVLIADGYRQYKPFTREDQVNCAIFGLSIAYVFSASFVLYRRGRVKSGVIKAELDRAIKERLNKKTTNA